ncbi:MAG: hypothetical protein HQ546_08290, partial [Planctomycetes bacterium]|nr:hypothetical protein [Planctomycetota bacterium]
MTASGLSVGLIAEAIGAQIEGDAKAAITGAAAIDTAVAGDITFVVDGRRARQLPECRATAVVAGAGVEVPAGMAVLRVVDVQAAFSKVLALLADPEDLPPEGVH